MYLMGRNDDGQLSYLDVAPTASNPVMKKCSVSNVKKICFGPYNFQALYYITNDGKLYAAGNNNTGAIGKGGGAATGASGAFLTQGPGSQSVNGGVSTRVKDAVLIGGGGIETGLCLFTDGTVKTVGYGGRGQIGNGNTANQNTWQSPVYAGGTTVLSNIDDIQGCGYDTFKTFFALDNSGVLYGWGDNTFGQLGVGTILDIRNKATTVGAINGIITDFWACGGYASPCLFIKYDNNKIYACGRSDRGQLGVGSTGVLTEVTSLLASYNIKEIIMAGMSHTYAVTEDDRILVCGYNEQGQCSVGPNTNLYAFEFCYTTMNNSSSLIKLKSGISRNNPYIDLKAFLYGNGFLVGNSWVLSNNNEAYTCGDNRFYTNTIANEKLYYLTRAKHWL
jgi:alpha-tubulin suppressor-like RCC1 family protein